MTLTPELREAALRLADNIDDRFRAVDERTRRIVREVLAEELGKIGPESYGQ